MSAGIVKSASLINCHLLKVECIYKIGLAWSVKTAKLLKYDVSDKLYLPPKKMSPDFIFILIRISHSEGQWKS